MSRFVIQFHLGRRNWEGNIFFSREKQENIHFGLERGGEIGLEFRRNPNATCT
jgi:hypothetical protein